MPPTGPRLFAIIPETRAPVLGLGVIGVLQGLASIATAFALTAVVVALVSGAPVGGALAWLAGLFVARGLLAGAAEYAAARAGGAVSAALRTRLLARWTTRPLDGSASPAVRLALATTGCASVEPYVARYLPAVVAAAVVPAGAVITLGIIDWPSALVVVLTLPLLPLFAALIGQHTQRETTRRRAALADLGGHFLDVVRGLPTLVGYGRAERQVATIGAVATRHRMATMRTLRIAFLSSAALELLATISVAIVAVLCGVRLAEGTMPLAAAMVAILLAPEAYWPIRRLGQEFHSAADGAQALAEIEALAEIQALAEIKALAEIEAATADDAYVTGRVGGLPGAVDAPSALVPAVVSYTYPGASSPTLRDVALSGLGLQAGRGLTVLTGPSGAGKSTLLEIIAGLRTPDQGTVITPAAHLLTQRPFLPVGTLRRALSLGNNAAPQAIWTALREVGMDGIVTALPDGLDTLIGDDGFGLSAGQRARIGLARALLAPEPVILLDEPTAHLDDAARAVAHAAITALSSRRTVIAVTHRADLVALADRQLRLTPAGSRAARIAR